MHMRTMSLSPLAMRHLDLRCVSADILEVQGMPWGISIICLSQLSSILSLCRLVDGGIPIQQGKQTSMHLTMLIPLRGYGKVLEALLPAH